MSGWKWVNRQVLILLHDAFVDGNKRAAFLAVGLFAMLNRYRLTATQVEATLTMLAVAADEMNEERFATWLREHLHMGGADAGGSPKPA